MGWRTRSRGTLTGQVFVVRGPIGPPPAGTWEGSVSKHAMPRSQRLGHLKVLATAILVLAFVTLFVGGATGMIGSRRR